MNSKKYEKIRNKSDTMGELDNLDSRYNIDISWMIYDPSENHVELTLSLYNPKTLDYIMLEGIMKLDFKHYILYVVDTNNERYLDEQYSEHNEIINAMSAELKFKFHDKLDIIFDLMQQGK
jgi:hypothetical protein